MGLYCCECQDTNWLESVEALIDWNQLIDSCVLYHSESFIVTELLWSHTVSTQMYVAIVITCILWWWWCVLLLSSGVSCLLMMTGRRHVRISLNVLFWVSPDWFSVWLKTCVSRLFYILCCQHLASHSTVHNVKWLSSSSFKLVVHWYIQ